MAAVVVAAGSGRRIGADRNKVWLPVGGKPILAWTLELLERAPQVAVVVLVAAASELDACRTEIVDAYGLAKVRSVPGGATRQESERSGVEALAEQIESGQVEVVLVHDGVRPFTEPAHIDETIEVARRTGAAILAVRAGPGIVLATPDGILAGDPDPELWAAQTPQAFDARLLLEAHRQAAADGFEATDTASVVERTGHRVAIVEGSYDNLKITTAADLHLADAIAARQARGERLLSQEVTPA